MKDKGTILLVEDTLESLRLLTEILSAEGHTVRPAGSGELALASAAAHPPELILLEIRMSQMDGFEVLRRLKAGDATRGIPVVILSAITETAERVEGLKLGAVDFVSKPFRKEELLSRIATHLELFRARRRLREQAEELARVNEHLTGNIAELEASGKALRESGKRLLEAQEVARLGYYRMDVPTGAWTSSKILDELFGIGDDYRRDVEGWSFLVHPEDRRSMLEYFLEDVLTKKHPFDREYRIVRPSDQCVRWVHGLGKVEYESGGKPVTMVGTIQDVTELKGAQEEKRNLERQMQQAQKLESLGVLAGGIAHDFNNILMAVLGHAELALDGISPMSPARGNLTEITIAARRAADLCRQMLAYAGKSSFELERVALRDLIEEMAHLLKTTISKKAILNLNLEKGLPPVQADPSQIRQIVMNLIINASEAIGDRSGVITVSVGATRCDEEYLRKTELREDLAPGLYVHIEVTDTGSGMDAKTRSRIFEPFFSTKFTGRGLGLAAVLGIVRAHKGALKVYSEPGKGTTFKILFPALADGEDAAQPLDVSPLADWRGKGTVLLVDDEESLIALGARMLEHLGLHVLTAADGAQAVDLYRERGKEIDLVLMDLTMPHMDGAKAFGELRRLNPEVRVILASGYSHEDVRSRFAGKSLDGVLQKPYTLSKLREALAGLLPAR